MAKSSLAHRLYKRIRPTLDNLGVLQVARRLFPKSLRENVAACVGLSEFDIHHASGTLRPQWKRVTGTRRKPVFDGVNYISDLRLHLGLSQHGRSLIRAMRTVDIPVAYGEVLHDISQDNMNHVDPDMTIGTPYAINVVDITPFLGRLKDLPPAWFRDKYVIATWFWEMNETLDAWNDVFPYLNEVWAGSSFVQRVISNVSTVPVLSVPSAIDVQLPQTYSRAEFNLPEDQFIFLYSFDPRSSIVRKNPFGYIEAFRRAFGSSSTDGPLLVLKTFKLETSDKRELNEDLQQAVESVGGRLIQTSLSRLEMNALLDVSNCYISPHRSEGLGLGLAEAMFLGKPVVGTAYSGNMDFMTINNSYLLRYHMRKITDEDHKYQPAIASQYRTGFTVAEPDLDHLAAQMTHVYENQAEARQIGLRAQADIQTNYSPMAVGEIIKARLKRITQENDS
jgi:glycosyltransferase involved in cell wall biosynthesis